MGFLNFQGAFSKFYLVHFQIFSSFLFRFSNFVQRFLDQGPDPYNDIRRNQVHNPKPVEDGQNPEIESWIDENEIGLENDKDHGQDDICSQCRKVTRRFIFDLQEGNRFQNKVNQRSSSKDQGSETNRQTSMALKMKTQNCIHFDQIFSAKFFRG